MQFQLVRAAFAVLALTLVGCVQHTRPPARAAKRTSVTTTSSAQQALRPTQPRPQQGKDAGRPSEPEMLDVDDAAFWLPSD